VFCDVTLRSSTLFAGSSQFQLFLNRLLRYFDFVTKKIRQIFEAPKNFGTGLSVSPGGNWMLYSQAEEDNTDIMLVQNFR
jgi:hypothetical protein